MTVVIQIGNSDNKLTQSEWADFVKQISDLLHLGWLNDRLRVHFQGFSASDSPYQNACFVIEEQENLRDFLLPSLTEIRKTFRQESVAVTFGDTAFL
jgi:hypothetical protein